MRPDVAPPRFLLLVLCTLACNHAGDEVFQLPTGSQPTTEHIPRFVAERTVSGGNDIFVTGSGSGDHRVTLSVRQGVTPRPWIGSLLLRVDPAAAPSLVSTTKGSWCNRFGAIVRATDNPGEWKITASHDDQIGCIFCSSMPNLMASVVLELGASGSWRVELLPVPGQPELCSCDAGCSSSLDLFGGTVTNPL